MQISIIILIIVVIILVFYFIATQRKLVQLEELTQNAMSQIGVQVTSRWDALTQLAKATKAYSTHEHDTLVEVIAARRGEIKGTSSPKEVDLQEQHIENVMAKVNAVAESYPDLKANTIYKDTMASINDYENKVRVSRMVFNDTVTKYNNVVKQIPSNIVANILKYTAKEYLQEDSKKADMPDLQF